MNDTPIVIIVPVYGEADGLENTISSILQQEDDNYKVYIACDKVSREREREIGEMCISAMGKLFHLPSSEDRMFAMKNIYRALELSLVRSQESIVGIVDGDDELWGTRVFSRIRQEYEKGYKCVWTKHTWDINGLNQSGPINDSINVYKQPWASSHFRTFLASYYHRVHTDNFKDSNGEFFERTYDQALMLPIIHLVHKDNKKTSYIDELCYIYKGRTENMSEDNKYQRKLENFIRKRGYVEKSSN